MKLVIRFLRFLRILFWHPNVGWQRFSLIAGGIGALVTAAFALPEDKRLILKTPVFEDRILEYADPVGRSLALKNGKHIHQVRVGTNIDINAAYSWTVLWAGLGFFSGVAVTCTTVRLASWVRAGFSLSGHEREETDVLPTCHKSADHV